MRVVVDATSVASSNNDPQSSNTDSMDLEPVVAEGEAGPSHALRAEEDRATPKRFSPDQRQTRDFSDPQRERSRKCKARQQQVLQEHGNALCTISIHIASQC